MAAFGNFAFVYNNLNRSKADCQGIATYCLYFVLSLSDYFEATGDAAAVAYLTPNVVDHLGQALGQWANPHGLRFVGWDDRTGSGFANDTTPETQAIYRLLAIRAFAAAGSFFAASGNAALGALYAGYAANFTAQIRAMGGSPWYGSFGLHASADAVNAGFLTPDEAAGIVALGALGDIVKLPSQSNFNQYFILQALSGLGQLDRGVESIRAIWGAHVESGATTFWETSHPSSVVLPPGPSPPPGEQSGWVSYCHPWSSGPTPWLTKHIVGLRALEPGFARVLVAPHVAHSMFGVSGSVASPHGAIAVNASRGVGGRAEAGLELALPAGVREAVVRLSSVTLARLGVVFLALEELEVFDVLGGAALPARVVAAEDAPLEDEDDVRSGRALSLEVVLPGGAAHSLRVRPRAAAAAAAAAVAPWAPLGSPFPPPAWPGQLLGSDFETQGSWLGRYGKDGFALFAFDAQPPGGRDPFCGTTGEGSSLQLECAQPGATIAKIVFASYGTLDTNVPCAALTNGSCSAATSRAVVEAACLGKQSCSVDASNGAFGGDPCPGQNKALGVVARCSSGGGYEPGGPDTGPTDRVKLPPYVQRLRIVNSTEGFLGTRGQWTNSSSDARALQDPDGSGRRALGYSQPCGGPTSPIDVTLTDAARASGLRYIMSAYYVDFAPSATCGALDGTARLQETYLLRGYPDLSPMAERVYLSGFGGGVWMSWLLEGDVRLRLSTMTGDQAVVSALAFDSAP